MLGSAARTMLVLVLAGLALGLSAQGAAARGGSGGVTVIVNGDGWTGQRLMKTRHSHRHGDRWAQPRRFGGSAAALWHKQRRLASENPAVRAFQRSATHRFGFHRHGERSFHKPPHRAHSKHSFHKPSHHAHGGHGFKGPRVIVIEPSGARRSATPNVVVLRGSSSAVTVLGGGKVVVLSTSPSFKHIVIGK